MDIDLLMKMLFHLIGGLGIFLLGMRYMSDGLQTIAGPSLRKMIAAATDNRFMACIAGVVVTCVVQSSSVTTVMTVGFVNSGIMQLHQAIGVILGANIGTTITGWILVLKIGKWGLPILGISAFVYLFSKQEKLRFIALALLGVGMVFFGLEVMKSGVKVIKSIPSFEAAFAYFQATSYMGVLQCAFVGCLLTILVQSSSATLGITIALATTGVIDFQTAAALVLGENIGTTITAMLASIGTTATAKRAAYFHVLFNIFGVIWVTSIFFLYIPFIEWLIDLLFGVENIRVGEMKDGAMVYPKVITGIATVHSVFNIVNTLIFLPLTHISASFLEKIVKDKFEPKTKMLTHLNFHHYDSPLAALEISGHEVNEMRDGTHRMLKNLETFYLDKSQRDRCMHEIFEKEEMMDAFQKEITEFLTDLLGDALSHEDVELAKHQLRISDEYESISDYITNIIKLLLRLRDNNLELSPAQTKEVMSLQNEVDQYYQEVMNVSWPEPDREKVELIMENSHKITDSFRDLRTLHWNRLAESKVEPLISTSYMDIIQAYRKIKNHLDNILEVQIGLK